MGNHSHEPVDIDPQALRDSRSLWDNFTKAMTFGVITVIAILIMMAVFLA